MLARMELGAALPLRGHGLVLRAWEHGDLDALRAVHDDPDVARWTPLPSPFGDVQARERLALATTRLASGRALQLAVTDDGGPPLGEVVVFEHGVEQGEGSVRPDPARNAARSAEIGYVVARPHRGRGLASRAVRVVAEHAVGVLGFGRLVLRIDDGNVASEHVARACGFARTTVDDTGLATWERLSQQRF